MNETVLIWLCPVFLGVFCLCFNIEVLIGHYLWVRTPVLHHVTIIVSSQLQGMLPVVVVFQFSS